MALTSKQEKFCQCIVSGMNQSDAYRAAYNCENMGVATINNNAYVLMQNNDISMRIEALRLPLAERLGLDIESYIREMWEIKNHALYAEEYSAATKAFENVGKVLGFYVNKTELTGKDGGAVDIKIIREVIDNK